jgi:hypothetical protein
MLVLARIASITSNPNTPIRQKPQKKHTILFGINIPAESVLTCASVVFVFVKEISRFSHKSAKVATVKSFWHRRRILGKFVL